MLHKRSNCYRHLRCSLAFFALLYEFLYHKHRLNYHAPCDIMNKETSKMNEYLSTVLCQNAVSQKSILSSNRLFKKFKMVTHIGPTAFIHHSCTGMHGAMGTTMHL